MTQTILSILGHGGFKLFILGFFFVMKAIKANAQKTKNREARLRGKTDISDFSTTNNAATLSPSALMSQGEKLVPPALSQPFSKSSAPSKSAPDASTSALGSPWSSNQNPFN